MSFFIPEDVGTTERKKLTPRRVLRIWEAHKGICVLCNKKIDGVRDKWFCEHFIALELSGPDEDRNIGPAHWSCKPDKDAADHRAGAQAKRRKRHHLGIRKPSRFPGSRDSRFKMRLDGSVVDRRTGEIISRRHP